MNASSSFRLASVFAAIGLASFLSLRSAHAESLCPRADVGQACLIGETIEEVTRDNHGDPRSGDQDAGSDAAADDDGQAVPSAVGTCVAATTTRSEIDGGTVSATSYGVCILLPASYCGPDETNQVCNASGNTCQSLSVLAPNADGTTSTAYDYGLCNGTFGRPTTSVVYDGDDDGDTGGIGCAVARSSTMSESRNVLSLFAGVALVVSRRRKRSIFSSKKR